MDFFGSNVNIMCKVSWGYRSHYQEGFTFPSPNAKPNGFWVGTIDAKHKVANYGHREKNAAKRSRLHTRIQRRLSFNERTHTRGRHTHSVTNWTDTQRGGHTHNECNPTNGHTYFHRGEGRTHNVTQQTDTHMFTWGTHPQCNPTNGHTETH